MKIQQLDLTVRELVAGCQDDGDGRVPRSMSNLTNRLGKSIIIVAIRRGAFNGEW